MKSIPKSFRLRTPATPSFGRVFISHSSKNQKLAVAIVAELEGDGIPCWISSRDIRPGDPNYGRAILEGLNECKAMVLLLTEPSNRSQHVMKEAERAVNRNIPILVVRYQPIDVSKELEYYVSSAQFLDASAPPPQQHFRTIRERLRDMLHFAHRPPAVGEVAIKVAAKQARRRPRWGLRFAGIGVISATAIAGWTFLVPQVQSVVSNLATTIAVQPSGKASRSRARVTTAESPSPDDPPSAVPAAEPAVPSPVSPGGGSSLQAGVAEKAKVAGSLEALAKSRLANFHREALTVSKSGTLTPGYVATNDVEVLASCRIQPNTSGYSSLAAELIRLLDKSALQKGTITSDGLKTSAQYGHDARPRIEELRKRALSGSGSLLDIFASDAHKELVRRQAAGSASRYASFSTLFLIYDERVTELNDAGIRSLRWGPWSDFVNQENTGVVMVLESAKPPFRHTTWRWFHVSAPDWAIISSHVPKEFHCVLTLTDSSGARVESDNYPLWQYGVVMLEHDQIMAISPFFVNEEFEHYIPEISLTKSIVVLPDDVKRVTDFTATIEEVREKAN